MKKISFSEMCEIFDAHNKAKGITQQFSDKERMTGVIVYKSSNWPDKDYSLESRSYEVVSDNKYFIPGMGGNSIIGDSLDGTDQGIRLDWYFSTWKIDYCYIKEK